MDPTAWLRRVGVPVVVAAGALTAGMLIARRPPARQSPLTVRIFANGCTAVPTLGGATALGGDRLVTVAHVVAGASEISLHAADGRTWPARIVAIDTERDIAVLAAEGLDEPTTRTRQLKLGDRGSFATDGQDRMSSLPFTVTKVADIASEDIYVKGEYVRAGYVLDAGVISGDSGTGLIGTDGALGGVVWATNRNTDGQGWGISIEVAAPLVDNTPADARTAPPVPCA